MKKYKVTYPKAKSGGSFGNSNANPQWSNNTNNSTGFSEPEIQVNQSLKPVEVKDANLEAELGETAFVPDESGIPALYKIGGERHYNGGTPLDLPEDSFIFSRDKKMKIGGPILESFGKKKDTKDKFTPAELSSQYKINDFRKVLADPNSDKTQRDTAELMISNYNLKLAKLGLVQESTKGFPNGIPSIAMPYIEMMQLDPSQFVAPQTSMGTAKYGGAMDQFGGGGPTTYSSEAEYKKHLTDPYSKEKEKAQMLWNIAHPVTTTDKYDYSKQLENISKVQKEIIDLEQQKTKKALEAKQQAEYKAAIKSEEKKQADYKWELLAVDNTIKKNLENTQKALKGEKVLWGSGDAADNVLTLKKELEILMIRQKELLKSPKTTPVPKVVSKLDTKQPVNVVTPQYGVAPVTPVDDIEPISSSSINNTKFISKPDTIKVPTANPYLKLGGVLPKYEPGGPVVTKYADGTTSTVYSDGKIEVKDASGKLLKTITGKESTYENSKGTVTTGINKLSVPATTPENDLQTYTGDKYYPENKSSYSTEAWRKFRDKYYPNVRTEKELQKAMVTDTTHPEFAELVSQLHEEFGPLKGNQNWNDGRLGHRWDAFLAKANETQPDINITPSSTSSPSTSAGPLSAGLNFPNQQSPKAKFWLQDNIKTAGAFGDLMTINKYNPWQATPGYVLEEGTFYDPTREMAANAEMVNQGVTGASTFSGPQGYAATAAMLQGQGAKNSADIMGRYNNMNVSEANRLNSANTAIKNNASQQRANAATQLFDKQTIANQQFDNSKNMARQNLRQSFMDAITNRANTANLNTMYPQYAVDPSNGGIVNHIPGSNRALSNTQGTAATSQSQFDALKKAGYSLDEIKIILGIKS